MDATHYTGFYVLDGIITGEWDAAWDAFLHLILPALALASIPLAIIVAHHPRLGARGAERRLRAHRHGQGHLARHHPRPLHPAQRDAAGRHDDRPAGRPAASPARCSPRRCSPSRASARSSPRAIFTRDYPVLQGFILFIAIVYALINLAVDVSYSFIDPRVRVT